MYRNQAEILNEKKMSFRIFICCEHFHSWSKPIYIQEFYPKSPMQFPHPKGRPLRTHAWKTWGFHSSHTHYCTLTLCTVFPYGLNNKIRCVGSVSQSHNKIHPGILFYKHKCERRSHSKNQKVSHHFNIYEYDGRVNSILSELRRHRNSVPNRFLLKTSFHALLTFIYFCYLFLFFGLCLLLLLVFLDIDPVLFVMDLHIKYIVEVVPLHTYIVWFVIIW